MTNRDTPAPAPAPSRSAAGTPAAAPAGTPAAGAACTEHRDAFGILAHCHDKILEHVTLLDNTANALRGVSQPSPEHLATLGQVQTFLAQAIPMHTADEEQTLFPRLRAAPLFAEAGTTPMDCMEKDHVVHAELRRALDVALEQLDATKIARAGKALAADYRQHIEKENEILFPLARQVLTDPALIEAMTGEMRARREGSTC